MCTARIHEYTDNIKQKCPCSDKECRSMLPKYRFSLVMKYLKNDSNIETFIFLTCSGILTSTVSNLVQMLCFR